MKSWQIIRHSVRQLTRNLVPALRISLLIYLAGPLAAYLLDTQVKLARFAVMQNAFGGGIFPWVAFLVPLTLTLMSGLWIGVAWHRYVLEEEKPGQFVPRWNTGAFLAYLWAITRVSAVGMFVWLFVGLAGVAILGLLSWISVPSGIGVLMIPVIVGVCLPVLVLWVRWSVVLPAAALGQTMTLAEAWRGTIGSSWVVLGAVIAIALMSVVANLPLVYWFTPLTLTAQLWQMVVGWFTMMIGLSFLTTMFGHYIQQRPLL